MRNITNEEFREFDEIARTLLNDHLEEGDLDSLDNMMALLDSMQDSMESATIVPNEHGGEWVLLSMQDFEIVEARVCQLLLLSVQAGGWDKVDAQERLWR